jgi:hypothetical protein
VVVASVSTMKKTHYPKTARSSTTSIDYTS